MDEIKNNNSGVLKRQNDWADPKIFLCELNVYW